MTHSTNNHFDVKKTPLNWSQLVNLSDELASSDIKYMRRYPHQELFYREFNLLTDKEARLDLLRDKINKKSIYLEPTIIPYDLLLAFLPQVQHFILWSKHHLSSEQVMEYMNKLIDNYKYIRYRNTPNKRTIPELYHLQIFVNFDTYFDTLEQKHEFLEHQRYYAKTQQ